MFTATDWIRDKNGLMVLTPFPIKWAGKAAKQVYHKLRQKDTIKATPPRRSNSPGAFCCMNRPENDMELPWLNFTPFGAVKCTPFVRQYGILFRKWGVFVCQRDNESTTERRR